MPEGRRPATSNSLPPAGTNADERAAVLGHFDWRNVTGGDSYHAAFERDGERLTFKLPLLVKSGGQPLWAISDLEVKP